MAESGSLLLLVATFRKKAGGLQRFSEWYAFGLSPSLKG
jgi:hypothetical protein